MVGLVLLFDMCVFDTEHVGPQRVNVCGCNVIRAGEAGTAQDDVLEDSAPYLMEPYKQPLSLLEGGVGLYFNGLHAEISTNIYLVLLQNSTYNVFQFKIYKIAGVAAAVQDRRVSSMWDEESG